LDSDLLFILLSAAGLIVLLSLGTFFSATEMAFASLNHIRVKSMVDIGGKKGKAAALVLRMYEKSFDEVIATLLICNNIVAIASATLSVALFIRLIGEWGYLVSTLVISAIVIVFTDIFPKSMANEQPERVALACAGFTNFLMKLLRPVNRGVLKIKNRLSKSFITEDDSLSQDEFSLRGQEIIYMVEQAEKEGTFEEDDSLIITNAVEFNDLNAWDIITPRVDIVSLPIDISKDDATKMFLENGYSRMPVYEGSLDNIKGIVHLRDFLKCIAKSGGENPPSLEDIISPAVYTVTSARITELLKLLQSEKSHMAIVTDEYGGTEGIVTIHDILERLVGNIWDEADEVIENFVDLGDNRFKINCTAYIADMFDYFGIKADSESNSVGGWIMDMLRRIPEVGDSFSFEGLNILITKVDQRRVEECIVEVAEAADEED
jgi:CBS domain containing-hemolysin-like protein